MAFSKVHHPLSIPHVTYKFVNLSVLGCKSVDSSPIVGQA
jgi:hypothetical protein